LKFVFVSTLFTQLDLIENKVICLCNKFKKTILVKSFCLTLLWQSFIKRTDTSKSRLPIYLKTYQGESPNICSDLFFSIPFSTGHLRISLICKSVNDFQRVNNKLIFFKSITKCKTIFAYRVWIIILVG